MINTRHSRPVLQLITLLLLATVPALSIGIFNTTPEAKIWQSFTPYIVVISTYLEDEVAVGLADGTINVYSLANQSLLYSLTGCHETSIKDIMQIRGNGWVSQDHAGTVCRWNSKRQQQMKWAFQYSLSDISVSFLTNGSALIGFNLGGDRVLEYDSETTSTVPKTIYKPNDGTKFQRIQYDGYGTKLFASTTSNSGSLSPTELQVFNCSNGLYMKTVLSANRSSRSFGKVSNGDILFYSNEWSVYQIDSQLNYTKTSLRGGPDSVVASLRNSELLYIALYTRQSMSMKVFNPQGQIVQELRYSHFYYLSVDVSPNYLVYSDVLGNLGIVKYAEMEMPIEKQGSLSIWIGGIVGAGLIIVVGIIVCAIMKSKRKVARTANNYSIFSDSEATTVAFIPKSQSYTKPEVIWHHVNKNPCTVEQPINLS